jgi:predicted RNase H-like HicB family nuclease
MLAFYVKIARMYIARGMTLEEALENIPEKWREGVRAVLEEE